MRAVRVSGAMLAVLALCACTAQAVPVPPVDEPTSTVSRIRVTNDSTTDLVGLELMFPGDDVTVGDVAAGATSAYVEVPGGVYDYSAFGYTKDGEHVIQRVIDFVGETPMPIDDYTYLLGVVPESSYPIRLLTVLLARPRVEPAAGAPAGHPPAPVGDLWVRVQNQGPDDVAGYTLRFPDQHAIYLGTIPAGTTTQYARLFGDFPHRLVGVRYAQDGTNVSQPMPAAGAPVGGGEESGAFTHVIRYDRDAADGQHVEQVAVAADS